MTEAMDNPLLLGKSSTAAPGSTDCCELPLDDQGAEAACRGTRHSADSASPFSAEGAVGNPPPVDLDPDDRPRSLAEALQHVAHAEGLKPELLRRLRSDIGTVAKMTGRTPAQLPCDPRSLRPIIRSVLPARYRITQKRWSNLRSAVARLLKM